MAARIRQRPVVLTVAGSDNSAGAGAQADLKSFSYFGCYGLTAITCVVAEVPGKVTSIQAITPKIVAEQMALNFQAFPVAALKTGMLYSAAIIEAVADVCQQEIAGRRGRRDGRQGALPIVIDPVMVASSGDPLLKKNAVAAYRRRLFPLATLVTPNLDELEILAGREVCSLAKMREAGLAMLEKFGCSFLLKGGHLRGKTAVDLLVTTAGVEEFSAPFRRGVDTHGTGCTYAAAITANLALGRSLSEAVAEAKMYITAAIGGRLRWGNTSALEHFPAGSLSGAGPTREA